MLRHDSSFLDKLIVFFKIGKQIKINELIKNNVIIIPLIYIVGTIALLIRNKIYGLPFSNITLLQFAVIVVYFFTFLGLYAVAESNMIEACKIVKNTNKKKLACIYKNIIYHLIYFSIAMLILIILTNSYKESVIISFSYLVFWPIFVIIVNNKNNFLSEIITVIYLLTIIVNIPMSIGGFKGQEVTYYNYQTEEKNEYTYYGNYDGLYQFVNDDRVILIPIESGYIVY